MEKQDDLKTSLMHTFLFHAERTCSTITKLFLGLMFKSKLKAHLQILCKWHYKLPEGKEVEQQQVMTN